MSRRPEKEIDYFAKILTGMRNRRYEFFVISRIFHILNDRELEITTQQLVRAKEGRFLLDLYFPQLKIAVEVDEAHHERQTDSDKNRERAVIEVVGDDINFQRIEIKDQPINKVCSKIDAVIGVIRERKKKLEMASLFVPFVYGQKYETKYWLERGRLSVSDDARFQTHVDVAKLFRKNYAGHQRATIKLNDGHSIWFPRLYENRDWDNKLSPNGKVIEMRKMPGGQFNANERNWEGMSYVFAHHRDEFGAIYYAFKGVFKIEEQAGNNATFARVADAIEFDGKGYFKPIEGEH